MSRSKINASVHPLYYISCDIKFPNYFTKVSRISKKRDYFIKVSKQTLLVCNNASA